MSGPTKPRRPIASWTVAVPAAPSAGDDVRRRRVRYGERRHGGVDHGLPDSAWLADDTVSGVIIDCHGHYTTAPAQLGEYRERQRAAVDADPQSRRRQGCRGDLRRRDPRQPRGRPGPPAARAWHRPHAVLAAGQLDGSPPRQRRTRADSGREHCNELIRRVCDLYPERFAPVCQLPQSPGAPIESVGRRASAMCGGDGIRRLQPQPRPERREHGTGHRCSDRYWYPLYEALCELDVPAMIHVSAACNANLHTTTSHYLGADTTAFTQLLTSDLFARLPGRCGSSFPTAGERCPITGVASAASPRTSGCRRSPRRCSATSGSTRASTTRRASTCWCGWSRSTTSCSLRRCSARCAASTRRPGTHFDDTRSLPRRRRAHRRSASADLRESNARRVFPRLAA